MVRVSGVWLPIKGVGAQVATLKEIAQRNDRIFRGEKLLTNDEWSKLVDEEIKEKFLPAIQKALDSQSVLMKYLDGGGKHGCANGFHMPDTVGSSPTPATTTKSMKGE